MSEFKRMTEFEFTEILCGQDADDKLADRFAEYDAELDRLQSLALRVVTVEEIKAECQRHPDSCGMPEECPFWRDLHCRDKEGKYPLDKYYTISVRPIYTDGTDRYIKLGR